MAVEFSGSGNWRQGSITLDADAVIKNLTIIERVQMPFVMSYALNRLGPVLQQAHRNEMQRVFRDPVPFTLNSIFYTKSDKQKLYSYIGVKEFGSKGNPASKYLYPTVIEGAGRKQVYDTRFSKALAHRGFTPSGSYMLGIRQSAAARLVNGRISPGQYTQVLFAIGAYDNDTYTGRRYASAKRAPKKEYFFARPGNKQGLAAGVYRRKGRDIDMLFKYFPSPPSVNTRYDFYGLTDRVVQQEFPKLVFGKLKDVMGGR